LTPKENGAILAAAQKYIPGGRIKRTEVDLTNRNTSVIMEILLLRRQG
jgi:hypothetical protein